MIRPITAFTISIGGVNSIDISKLQAGISFRDKVANGRGVGICGHFCWYTVGNCCACNTRHKRNICGICEMR